MSEVKNNGEINITYTNICLNMLLKKQQQQLTVDPCFSLYIVM